MDVLEHWNETLLLTPRTRRDMEHQEACLCPSRKARGLHARCSMKTAPKALLQQCRDALLQHSGEHIAALLGHWLEGMIGEEDLEEVLDDLCLLLHFRVLSWGSQHSYATYTSWWEVEGSLEPSEGTFFCAEVASLRQRLLDLPLKQFDLLVELAYQTRAREAELAGEPHPPTGPAGLRELATWLAGPLPASLAEQRPLPRTPHPPESPEERRLREQAWADQACQQGFLVRSPDTPQGVLDAFRLWCKAHAHPYFWVEPQGRAQATLRAQARKTVGWREAEALLARFREALPPLCHPYFARAEAQGFQARLIWFSRRHVALEGILAKDAEEAAREAVALWSALLAEERVRRAEQEELRRAELEPLWLRELKRWRDQGPPDLPALPEEVVLPPEWETLFSRDQLSAFLASLGSPARSRDPKALLVQRALERLATEPTARARFFELFQRELAVPPWELEAALECTPTERKRWTEEGRLPVVERRGFRKPGRTLEYPVFDRRVVLGLSRAELERWRDEHQRLVQAHRRAGAEARAAKGKNLPAVDRGQPETRTGKRVNSTP